MTAESWMLRGKWEKRSLYIWMYCTMCVRGRRRQKEQGGLYLATILYGGADGGYIND